MSVKAINFEYSSEITVINKIQFDEHIKLYKNYINKYNEIEDEIALDPKREEANAIYSKFRGLKRGETYSLDAIILHELYFENIGGVSDSRNYPAGVNLPGFESYDQWRDDFVATAKASRGWVVYGFEQRTKKFMNVSLDEHDYGNIVLVFPILVIDVYEHAYFLDYGVEKAMYIDAFVENVNWDVVNCRLDKLHI